MDDTITPGEKDYSALVAKLKQAGIDVLYFAGYQVEGGAIVRQMRQQNMQTVVMGRRCAGLTRFLGDHRPGRRGHADDLRARPDSRSEKCRRHRPNENGRAARPTAIHCFPMPAVQAWAEAATKAGSVDARKVADQLHALTFDTTRGVIKFDAKGDVQGANYVVYRWHDGGYAELDPQP